MRDTLRQIVRSPALILAILLCLGGVVVGLSRDIIVMLIGVVTLPVLLIVAIVCCVFDRDDPRGGNVKAWAPVLIALAPFLLFGTGMLRDRLSFVGWTLLHPATALGERDRDGIILHWDAWGFGGSENDSYLVADPRDAIGTLPAAEAWRRQHGHSCEIVDTQRMAPRRYIVTTYNCSLSGGYLS